MGADFMLALAIAKALRGPRLALDTSLAALLGRTFPALRAEPRYFRPWHTYPLSLQRSPDLSTWEGMPGNFRLDSSGAIQWLDQSGTILDKAFYRLRIQP
ncbi:MAG: hypothetical protein CMP27_02095 [Roseibacillus sp.]|nr:hypothetical protein [Roseibacillus sp.]